jgi:predicted dehydrogenase
MAAVSSRGDRIRVCIVGFGGRGVEQIDALLEGDGAWDVVGVADRSAIAYARLQARYYDRRIPVVRRAADLVALEPDAILVSTTAAAHAPVSLELLEAGYEGALLIEKPVASSAAAARRLREATSGGWPGRAAVDFQRRCSRMYDEAAGVVASGELGRIRSISYATETPQRISMDCSHQVDLANWLAGAPATRVAARLEADATVDRRGAFYFDPAGVVDVEYENGATFRLDTTGSPEGGGLSVVCEQGALTVDHSEQAVVVTAPAGERTIPTDVEARPRMTAWFESTLRALTAGDDGLRPCTVDEAVQDLEVVVGAFVSSDRGGVPVVLPLAPAEAELELRIA